MQKKQFFMGSLWTPFIMGMIVIAISVCMCLWKPVFAMILFFSILTALVILSLINFAKADEKGITFFSFTFLPARYNYADILSKISLKNPQGTAASGTTVLFLKNGKRKILRLGLYPIKTQEKFQSLLSENISAGSSFFQEKGRLDLWLKSAKITTVRRRIFIGAVFIIISCLLQIRTRLWDWRIEHWHHTEAVITENRSEQINHAESIYHFKYQYVYGGKTYCGIKIAGDSERLSGDFPPGTKMTCIVNPEKPEDAALLTKYRADWLMFAGSFLFLLVGTVFLIRALIPLCRKIRIPDLLKEYIVSFEPEKIQELTFSICGECKISVGKISGAFQEIENRYGSFPPKHSVLVLLTELFFITVSILLGTMVMPHFLLVAIMIMILMWKTVFPRGVVFDKGEKKIYWSRFFSLKSVPLKIKKNDILNESDIVAVGLTIRKDYTLMVSVIRKDGVFIPVANASQNRMEQLFSDTVKIAERIGHLPIIMI